MENINHMKAIRKVILTFDVEDFINNNAINSLFTILKMLKKYNLRGLFFITGHMAEKLSNSNEIVNLLMDHEIGFHSSSHSVRPFIQEYTDVKSYDQAYSISLKRETAHINPLTGKMEGKGGINLLKNLFHPKKIEAFRAPGGSWNPPHLEALVHLGIKFDFSSNLTTSTPAHYREVTFYPYTSTQKWVGTLSDYTCLLSTLLRRKVTVFDLHPTWCVNAYEWDTIYFRGNPSTLIKVRERSPEEVKLLFTRLELLLKQINLLRHTELIDVDPELNIPSVDLTMNENDVHDCYSASIRWPKRFFDYSPKYVYDHFHEFFEAACC
jgi:peptidoglycan/xylan/chitin deacetylase (PgdA/CDA1 family)